VKSFTILFVSGVGASILANQTSPPVPAFEVASVRRCQPGGRPYRKEDPAMIRYFNYPLVPIMMRAYGLPHYQIVGPSWLETERYDIVATVPKGSNKAEVPAMLRGLLMDRFHMRVHEEMRQTNVYALVVGKGGPKLRRPESVDGPEVIEFSNTGTLKARTLASLASMLSSVVDRPVVNMTGLEGNFDISLSAAPEDFPGLQRIASQRGDADGHPPGDSETLPLPSVFTAVRELGLRLEPRKLPLRCLIVDFAEKLPRED
jgi:uncharacterized protein (TIGR03435 family)